MIKDPNQIAPAIVDTLKQRLGETLECVIMHGDAVSHEFKPGSSAVSLLILLQDVSCTILKELSDGFRPWTRKGMMETRLMNTFLLKNTIELFPIEILNIQRSYRVLYGKDSIENINLSKSGLLRQCRKEFTNIILKTSGGYIQYYRNRKCKKSILQEMLHSLLPVFYAILVLYDKKIPHATTEVIAAVEDLFGFGASVLSELYLDKRRQKINNVYTSFYDIITIIYRELQKNTIAEIDIT